MASNTSKRAVSADPRLKTVGQFVLDRQGQLENIRTPWADFYNGVSELTNVIREDYMYDYENGPKKIGTNLYDGTPLSAINLFADGLHGYMISPAIPWFRLALPRHLSFLADIPEINQWRQETESGIYSAFQSSNFYSEMRPFLKDGGSSYAATIGIEEDIGAGKVVFDTLPPREIFIAQNKYGQVDVMHRKYKISARVAGQSFKKDDMSAALKTAIRDTPFKEYEFVHAIYPRTDFNSARLGILNKRYASVWIESKTGHVLKESGFDIFPRMVWRYAVAKPSPYAYCPAAFSLPENKALQSMSKTLLRAGEVAVDPPMMIPSDNEGDVHLGPNGLNYYGADPKRLIYPIQQIGNYPLALQDREERRQMLREHFHVDFFLMLAQSQRQMTATEIIEKMGEKASVLSAAIGDLTNVLDQVIDYVFQIEYRSGRLPRIPDILLELGGANIDIVYQGSLAQAQRRLFETQNIKLGLEDVAMVGQIYPEALDIVDPDKTLRELLQSDNFPQSAMRDPDVIEAMRGDRAERAFEEQGKSDSERQAKTLKDFAQAFKNAGGNAEILQQMTGTAQ